jgi:filamentous hemagglutinin family protein
MPAPIRLFDRLRRPSRLTCLCRGLGRRPFAAAFRPCVVKAVAAWLAMAAQSAAAEAPPPAVPQAGSVAAGSASIATSGNSVTVTQHTPRAIVNWRSFDVAAGGTVRFEQPGAASAILNRVTGGTGSTIAGSLVANGQVFLVNPNGITISPTGTIRAHGFVASTLDIADDDFLSGKLSFRGTGVSARVLNAGSITGAAGGFAALLAGRVDNAGSVVVPAGRVGLASGERIVLDLSGNGFLQVALPAGDGGIDHSGTIRADGGFVQLSAAAARESARRVVNMTGVIEARSVQGVTGSIKLDGADGSVRVAGSLDASGGQAGTTGGSITVTGREITLAGASLDGSGPSGGGSIRVGGDIKGGGALARARSVDVDSETTLNVDARSTGSAGSAVIWSDERTRFEGSISGRAASGLGGFAEVSSAGWLGYAGSADLRGQLGFGTLLLDPRNVTISTGTHTGGFSASADNSVINTTTLQNALATANVTVDTGSTGTQAGTITVANAVTWSSGSTLTLDSASTINVNAPITGGAGAGLTLRSGANILFNQAMSVSGSGGTGVELYANGSILGTSGGAITTQGQRILLNSDRDANGVGTIDLNATTIRSNGGAITFGGGNGFISAGSGFARGSDASGGGGVNVMGGTVAAGGGDILMNGLGTAGVGVNIDMGANVSTTGSGTIGLTGTGGSSGWSNRGVRIVNAAAVSSVGGAITVVGTGGGTGSSGNNVGVLMSWNALGSASGAISVTGTGGNLAGTGDGNAGVFMTSPSPVATTAGGAITVVGIGGGSSSTSPGTSQGVRFGANGRIGGSGGAISITGTALRQGNAGVALETGSVVVNTGSGSITINGTGANSGSASISTGVDFQGSSTITAASGTIAISGTAGSAGGIGVSLGASGSRVQTSAGGAISITGNGASGATAGGSSHGISLVSGAQVSGSGGAVTLAGSASSTTGAASHGIVSSGGMISNSAGGRISITGNAAAAGAANGSIGILTSAANVISSPAGAVDVRGDVISVAALDLGSAVTTFDASASFLQTGALTADFLRLIGAGVSYQLTHSGNSIGTLAADTGSLDVASTRSITVGTVAGTTGVTSSGAVQLRTTGASADIVLNSPIASSASGDAVVLASSRNFTNNAGSGAVVLTGAAARFLAYSADWDADTRGGLSAGSLYARGFASTPAAAVTQTGSHFLYARQPVLTLTAANLQRVYGEANPALSFGASGLVNADSLASALNGGVSLSSSASQTSGVGTYAIDVAAAASSKGYSLVLAPGSLDVTPRPILLTIEDSLRPFGQPNPRFVVSSGSMGLVNGDSIRGEPSTSAGLMSESGAYPISAGTLSVGPNYAPRILPGTLFVMPAAGQGPVLLVREQTRLTRDPETKAVSDTSRTTLASAAGEASGDARNTPVDESAGAGRSVVDPTSPTDRGPGTTHCSDRRGSKASTDGSRLADCDHGGD